MPNKEDVAKVLANAHRVTDPEITRIVRLVGENEQDPNEPIKLLEVNAATPPSGVVPIAFAPDPPDIPYPSIVIEVTPDEYAQIVDGKLMLPKGWTIEEVLYSSE